MSSLFSCRGVRQLIRQCDRSKASSGQKGQYHPSFEVQNRAFFTESCSKSQTVLTYFDAANFFNSSFLESMNIFCQAPQLRRKDFQRLNHICIGRKKINLFGLQSQSWKFCSFSWLENYQRSEKKACCLA